MFFLMRKKIFVFKVFIFINLVWISSLFYLGFNIKNDSKIKIVLSKFINAGSLEKVIKDDSLNEDGVFLPPPGSRDGPGEMGKPVVLSNLTSEQQKLVKEGWNNNKFNQYVSDLISVHRQLPDVRWKECRNEKYPPILPQTSVIICFTNESWSVLLRTIHSVLSRSPPHLLREIVLVDDISSMPHLGQQLETYVSTLEKVRIVRAKTRQGLIRARIMGGKHAHGPVLTYLDSHCEVTEGWLEPLLARIAINSTTVVCPDILGIDKTTFELFYKGQPSAMGGFKWNLLFYWVGISHREIKRRVNYWDPIRSPTMAGGLFAIDKAFFAKLGWYDPGFEIWGAENLEISFKAWMCGGSLEIVPCSRVGHVFRGDRPYSAIKGINHFKRNAVRLAEVWLDDYKYIYFQQINYKLGDYGDVSSRKELRRNLQCKSFKWFLENVYPEMFVPTEAVASGEVINMGMTNFTCLDGNNPKKRTPIVYPCHKQGGNQVWYWTQDGELRTLHSDCLDYTGSKIITYPCHGLKGNQQWTYDHKGHQIKMPAFGKCLGVASGKTLLAMKECNPNDAEQKWFFQNYNPLKIKTRQDGNKLR